MRITSFEPPSEQLAQTGLAHVSMNRLGRVVALAGPNGGGKTRILELLRQNAANFGNRSTARRSILREIQDLESHLRNESNSNIHDNDYKKQRIVSKIEDLQRSLSQIDVLKFDSDVASIRVVNFVPKRLELTDPLKLTISELSERPTRVRKVVSTGIDMMPEVALAYIQRLQDHRWEATHPDFSGAIEDKTNVEADYERLVDVLRQLLMTTLERAPAGQALLFGRPLGACFLSDGQKVLLQLAIAIHPVHQDASVILTMDEPENHLHPAALLLVLDRIRAALPNAQVWLATHSVPLLSHLYAEEPSCLYFVEGGRASFAGRAPEKVLRGLLGDEEEQSKLLNFIDLPHAIAATQFAAGCLRPPEVAEHQWNDSQVEQIRKLLRSAKTKGAALKVLDLGAGKGRLLAGLSEDQSDIASSLNYVAFDTSAKDKDACQRQLAAVYGNTDKRWYSDVDQLFSHHGETSFDAVVMCNVLHEIPPDDWLQVLGEAGTAYRALAPHGVLLIVEDLRIPVGELPNHRGFFLLDTIHLQKLFDVTISPAANTLSITAADARGDGRLKAHAVPRALLSRITTESRRICIEALRDTSLTKLRDLRNSPSSSFSNGHINSLWSQQFTSCYLYLQTA